MQAKNLFTCFGLGTGRTPVRLHYYQQETGPGRSFQLDSGHQI
jgi:hypothetical protein